MKFQDNDTLNRIINNKSKKQNKKQKNIYKVGLSLQAVVGFSIVNVMNGHFAFGV